MNSTLGFFIIVIAGLLNGGFALPMKLTKRWAWENTWLIYSLVGMVIVNWVIAYATLPQIPSIYAQASTRAIVMVLVFGFIWGTGNLLFGVGIDMVGISLAFPLCLGLSVTLGTIVPPLKNSPELIATPYGIAMLVGLAIIVMSIVLFAWAGTLRDAQAATLEQATQAPEPITPDATVAKGVTTIEYAVQPASKTRVRIVAGITVAIVAGLFDPTLNFALAFGDGIKSQAEALGASTTNAPNSIWLLVLVGSFFMNAIYCTYLLFKNRTWSRFVETGTFSHWWLAALMGTIWMMTIILYGWGDSKLTHSGMGWPVFYGCIIISSTFWGVVTGEWRGGQGRPMRTLLIGVGVMLLALGVFAIANKLAPE